jgi:hypothetical protein
LKTQRGIWSSLAIFGRPWIGVFGRFGALRRDAWWAVRLVLGTGFRVRGLGFEVACGGASVGGAGVSGGWTVLTGWLKGCLFSGEVIRTVDWVLGTECRVRGLDTGMTHSEANVTG